MLHCFVGWIALHMHKIAVNPLNSFLIKHMHIPPPLKTIPSVSVTYTSLNVSGYPSVGVLHVQHLLSKNWFKAILENVNNTLRLRCIPSALKHEYCVRGWGGLERVGGDLRGYRTCYNGQALGTFSPGEATMATAQSLSAEALEPVGSYAEIHNLPPAGLPACLSHPGLPVETSCQAKHPLMKNKYNAVSLATSQAANDSGNSNL